MLFDQNTHVNQKPTKMASWYGLYPAIMDCPKQKHDRRAAINSPCGVFGERLLDSSWRALGASV